MYAVWFCLGKKKNEQLLFYSMVFSYLLRFPTPPPPPPPPAYDLRSVAAA